MIVEFQYVDRDYIEDHSAFYATSRKAIPNVCKRIHFFRFNARDLRRQFDLARELGAREGHDSFEMECARLSSDYLGFCVLKPLPGCPVGRTVLRPPAIDAADFGGTRIYRVHVAGVELHVRGLAFQQQDVGVSACATTALWSAFHKVLDFEEIALPTPAKITTLAALHSLPHGRAMPSEGLSVDQMCQATQAIGLAPVLFRAEDSSVTRAYLYAACLSGFAPVLILRSIDGTVRHAVTVSGMQTTEVDPDFNLGWLDLSHRLDQVFVHDDRHGPYLPASFFEGEIAVGKRLPHLRIAEQPWVITQILVPVHPKVRISFSNLFDIAYDLVTYVNGERQIRPQGDHVPALTDSGISFSCRIIRSDRYLKSLILDQKLPDLVNDLTTRVPLSRYIGIIQMEAPFLDKMDVLVDTTSTMRNLNFFAVVAHSHQRIDTTLVGSGLTEVLHCPFVEQVTL